jgi:hypothetical protein
MPMYPIRPSLTCLMNSVPPSTYQGSAVEPGVETSAMKSSSPRGTKEMRRPVTSLKIAATSGPQSTRRHKGRPASYQSDSYTFNGQVQETSACHYRLAKSFITGGNRYIPEYFTLSHRWGYQKFFCLKQDTLKSLLHQILMKALPQTFQDAIGITERLGCQCLWIDSLCIIQSRALAS